MTGLEYMHFGVWHVATICLRLRKLERPVVLAPQHEQSRLPLAHPGLPCRIGTDVRAVVIEQVALDLGLAGLIEEGVFVGPEVRVVAFHVRIIPYMAGPRR